MNGSPNSESYVLLTLADGSQKDDRTFSWSSVSNRRLVDYFGKKKTVFTCFLPVRKVDAYHDGLETSIEIPEDCEVYQAFRSRAAFNAGQSQNDVVGRCIGIVRNGAVIEERFLNGVNNEVQGVRI